MPLMLLSRHTPALLLLTALLGLSQCHDKADPSPNPVDQLPPATQEGKNTLGCLVNGQPWTPAGFDGTDNFSIDYDRGLGGVFDLRAYRYQQKPVENYQYLIIFANGLQNATSYDLRDAVKTRVSLNDRLTGCYLSSRDSTTYHRGTLTITRLDTGQGIIAGTFDFVLAKPGCDTVRVTNGRFDYKF